MIGLGRLAFRAFVALARRIDERLADPGDDARAYDFRGTRAETGARVVDYLTETRVVDYLTETRVALLDASIDLFNLVEGFGLVDVKLAQAAFRQDVTA